jgi:hypothetical protein
MIIKSRMITHDTFVYDNNKLEEVPSYKYIRINFHHNLNWNYSIERRINGGWKSYYGLEKNCKLVHLWIWDKNKFIFKIVITSIILYGCEVWGCNIFIEF